METEANSQRALQEARVAIVHDWLLDLGGAERVLQQLLKLFPQADLFSTVCFLKDSELEALGVENVSTSFIQRLPFSKGYRKYLPLMPLAMESLDFRGYDLIISSSSAVAKGLISGPDQTHICYCHSPMRYIWDMQEEYLDSLGLQKGIRGAIIRWVFSRMRDWDCRNSLGVDYFIANSNFIARRIFKTYRREAHVIHPGIELNGFSTVPSKEDFYLTCSRLVPYKRIPLIVEAFSDMPDKKLVVIGDGPDMQKVRMSATKNVEVLGYQPDHVVRETMSRARAFVYAAEEDFGIVPVEAQASGTPVICYAKGGALETVVPGKTGVYFHEQTSSAICRAVGEFESQEHCFEQGRLLENASRFSAAKFQNELSAYVSKCLASDRSSNTASSS